MDELSVQLKARNSSDKKVYKLFPATKAENVVENENKRFVTDEQIRLWTNGVDNTESITNKDIDDMFGKKITDLFDIDMGEAEKLDNSDIADIFNSNRFR